MIAAVILAAGGSRRLGQPKQLVDVRGEPLIRRIARIALAASDKVVVVQGAVALDDALAGLRVALVDNPGWSEGMASSIRAGIRAASDCEAALMLTCDQHELDPMHLVRLVAHPTLAASRYDGVLGIPALFPRCYFDELFALTGDRGAQALLDRAIPVDWPGGERDLDTPAQIDQLDRTTS